MTESIVNIVVGLLLICCCCVQSDDGFGGRGVVGNGSSEKKMFGKKKGCDAEYIYIYVYGCTSSLAQLLDSTDLIEYGGRSVHQPGKK